MRLFYEVDRYGRLFNKFCIPDNDLETIPDDHEVLGEFWHGQVRNIAVGEKVPFSGSTFLWFYSLTIDI